MENSIDNTKAEYVNFCISTISSQNYTIWYGMILTSALKSNTASIKSGRQKARSLITWYCLKQKRFKVRKVETVRRQSHTLLLLSRTATLPQTLEFFWLSYLTFMFFYHHTTDVVKPVTITVANCDDSLLHCPYQPQYRIIFRKFSPNMVHYSVSLQHLSFRLLPLVDRWIV